MKRSRFLASMVLAAAFVAPISGCGSDGPAGGGIGSIDEIQDATIYISSMGLQELPTGTSSTTGSGSGFFITETGLAMTNYHVVAGAVTLEAYIGGDASRAYPVSIVGASQCNDLALVQVHLGAGETVAYLNWHEGEPTVGLPIYAAGYPLGDTEFTLTSGIVSKARADGEQAWASIDYTIEIDANIHQGNSGGPVVDERGAVVGVVYANAQTMSGQNQFFAIGAPLAQVAAEAMKDGDYESFGVWGEPLQAEDGSYLGLWVSAVESGSVADESGVLPGDLIAELNGLATVSDGTLATYCDVIRTSGADPIEVTIIRLSTGEVLSGDLGGLGGLTVIETFEPSGDPGGEDPEWTDDGPYDQYISVIDDLGLVYVDLPAEWSDLVTAPVDSSGIGEYPAIHASTDLAVFFSDYRVPGLQLLWLPGSHYQDVSGRAGTDGHVLASCELESVSPYDFATPSTGREYSGELASYIHCDGTLSQVVILWAKPTDGSEHVLYLAMVLASPRDLEALSRILVTLSMSDAG